MLLASLLLLWRWRLLLRLVRILLSGLHGAANICWLGATPQLLRRHLLVLLNCCRRRLQPCQEQHRVHGPGSV